MQTVTEAVKSVRQNTKTFAFAEKTNKKGFWGGNEALSAPFLEPAVNEDNLPTHLPLGASGLSNLTRSRLPQSRCSAFLNA